MSSWIQLDTTKLQGYYQPIIVSILEMGAFLGHLMPPGIDIDALEVALKAKSPVAYLLIA